MLTALLDHLPRLPAFRVLLAEPDSTSHGLLQAAHPFVTAGLYHHRPGPLILLTARSETAQEIAAQLAQWLPPPVENGQETAARILVFAEPDSLPYERIRWSSATRQQRLTALAALQSRTQIPPIVVASARALAQKTLPARELRLALRPIAVGDFVRLEQMAQTWAQTGYNPVDVVEEPGAFARRGGIVDIWPPNLPNPVRIDLFGDEVESLRIFDPATQRTLRRVDSVQIGPGSEVLSKFGPAALERLGVRGGSLTDPSNLDAAGAEESPLLDPRLLLAVREELRLEVDHLSQGHSFHGIEWYLPYFYAQPATLVDYLPPASTLVIDDAAELVATLHDLEEQAAALHGELVRSGDLPRLPAQLRARRRANRAHHSRPTHHPRLWHARRRRHLVAQRPGPLIRAGAALWRQDQADRRRRRQGAPRRRRPRPRPRQAARLQDTLKKPASSPMCRANWGARRRRAASRSSRA